MLVAQQVTNIKSKAESEGEMALAFFKVLYGGLESG